MHPQPLLMGQVLNAAKEAPKENFPLEVYSVPTRGPPGTLGCNPVVICFAGKKGLFYLSVKFTKELN